MDVRVHVSVCVCVHVRTYQSWDMCLTVLHVRLLCVCVCERERERERERRERDTDRQRQDSQRLCVCVCVCAHKCMPLGSNLNLSWCACTSEGTTPISETSGPLLSPSPLPRDLRIPNLTITTKHKCSLRKMTSNSHQNTGLPHLP